MKLSQAARDGHTCGDCGHGVPKGWDEVPEERRCLRPVRDEGQGPLYPSMVCHVVDTPACSRWKAEKKEEA
jgi:hypothetical protein